jgi:hypothetical protein
MPGAGVFECDKKPAVSMVQDGTSSSPAVDGGY